MGRCARGRKRKKRVCGDVNLSADPVNVNLMQWLTKNGWRPERPLKLCSFPDIGGCRGLKCVEAAVPVGGVLVSIPARLLVTRDLALSSLPEVDSLSPFIGGWSTQQLLSAFLLHERSNSNSFWAPYLQSLPATYDVPFFCNREEFECFPRYLKVGVMTSRRSVQRAYNKVRSLLSSVSMQSFAWAWFAVNTRAVYMPVSNTRPEDSMALAPFLDMFNHSFEASVNAGINVGGGKDFYQIVTGTGIGKSQQAFINYGPHTNLKMFLEYGFVLPGNPNDVVPVDLEELMEIAGRPLSSLKMKILESSGLATNMGIHATGISWNTLACLHILGLPEHLLSSWREVYEVDLEATVGGDKCELKELLRRKSVELTSSMSTLTALTDKSDSAKIALRMITLHHEIIVAAEKSYFNY